MGQIWLYSLLSVGLVSLVSVIGVVTISMNIEKLRRALLFLVSFAAGSLIGGAFLHLLPEAIEQDGNVLKKMYLIISGIIFFFALEKILFWRHCHIPTSEQHRHPVGLNNLIGDGAHNLIDGMIIAGSYLVSIPLGISTTVAVLLHEIPQEIGDYSILIYAGYTKGRALFLNLLSAVVAIVGAVLTLTIGTSVIHAQEYLIPLTIGGFIYIATADLIPELKEETHTGRSALQLFAMVLGVAVAAGMLLLE